MEIFGLGLVALFMYIGMFLGRILGQIIGVDGDVGGVGLAILVMAVFINWKEKRGKPLSEGTGRGIVFLAALYIPVVVAMSSNQNVVLALESGITPIAAGALATVTALLLVPVMSRIGGKKGIKSHGK